MTRALTERTASGPLVSDGAMATALHARGIAIGHCFEELNRSQAATVAAVHRAYVEAGAQLIFTNTFGANRYKLAQHGLARQVGEINAAGAALAREVVAHSSGDVLIAGDVGPLGVRVAPFGRMKPADARAAFREQIEALVQAGVDAIVIETMSDLREVAEAIRAARDLSGLPLIATMSFTRDDRTLLGEDPAAVALRLAELGADYIGVNCSGGPAQAMRVLTAMRRAAPSARFALKPNAGWPEEVGGRIMYPATPEYFGEYALAFARAGASIVGGCCGTTPAHIAAMRAALDDLRRTGPQAVRTALSPPARVERRDATPPPAAKPEPTRLATKLAARQFVISVEMDPPRGFSTHKLLAGAHLLAEAGADVINVADSPMARMRMSPWAACHLIQSEVGIETVLHFPTRGRNLLRVQGDLLAAHALGIRNVFVMMGDPTSIGDHPNASDEYDVVPSGLITLIKQKLNVGVDQAGAEIGEPTSFVVGCAVNLCAPAADKEVRVLHKKIIAGADFALTQPVYEVAAARDFIRRYELRYGRLDLPLLVGVLPLYNERHAAFLHNEVPGIRIPEKLRERMAGARESGADEGIRIAGELITQLEEIVQGVYLMPPFGRYDMAAEIIDRIRGLTPREAENPAV